MLLAGRNLFRRVRLAVQTGVVALALVIGAQLVPRPVSPPTSGVVEVSCDVHGFVCHQLSHDAELGPISIGVRVATSTPKGTIVVTVGGPGIGGLHSAPDHWVTIDGVIAREWNVVFWDPRGTGGSGLIACPKASTTFAEQAYGTVPTSDAAAEGYRRFAQQCTAEMGVDAPVAPQYSTIQAVADLRLVIEALRIDHPILLGESYGTLIVQGYIDRYPTDVRAAVLDAPADPTVRGPRERQMRHAALVDVLGRVSDWCDAEPACAEVLASVTLEAAYAALHTRLEGHPVRSRVTASDGKFVEFDLGTDDLELAIGNLLGSPVGRRAAVLAIADGANDDLLTLSQLALSARGFDPATLQPTEAVRALGSYFSTRCQDLAVDGFQDATVYLQAIPPEDVLFKAVHAADLPCAYWPTDAPQASLETDSRHGDLRALIVAADSDPYTPFGPAVDVFEGYPAGTLVKVAGGGHVSLGANTCARATFEALLDGQLAPGHVLCRADFVAPLAR